MRTWVSADLHLGHKNILRYEPGRLVLGSNIWEMEQSLMKMHNEIVKPSDLVIHLGDVAMTEGSLLRLNGWNGRKWLILGNHDRYSVELYRMVYEKVKAYKTSHKGKALLSHIPVHPGSVSPRYDLNIHGHRHSKEDLDGPYLCVSVEKTGYSPVLLDDVVKNRTGKGVTK